MESKPGCHAVRQRRFRFLCYTFDFKDGTIVGPQISPICVHLYTVSGSYRVLVTVRGTAGNSSESTVKVNVKNR